MRIPYINYLLLILLIGLLYVTGKYDYDLGDYRVQTENLLQYDSFLKQDSIRNRYPPVTSLVYYGFIKSTSPAPLSNTILILHLLLAAGIQFVFNKLLTLFGYNKENNLLKAALRSVVILNPFILSFVIRGANSELLYILFSLSALWFLLSYRKDKHSISILLTGIGIGLAILTRTQGYTLFLASAILLLYFNARWKLLYMLIPVLVLVGTWQQFNARYSDSFISTGVTPSFRDGLSFNNKPHRTPMPIPASVDSFSRKFYELYYIQLEDKGIPQPKTEREWVTDYLIAHPGTAVDLAMLKFFRCFYGTDSQNQTYERINKILIGAIMLTFLLSIWYLIRIRQWNGPYLFWISTVCALNVGMSMMALSILRYQAPLLPYLFIVILLAIDKRFRPIS